MVDTKFQVFLADTWESLRLHYMIRYRVFCLERQYEDAGAFPDKMERDLYDDRSAHFLLRETETGQWAAAMRLVIGPAPSLPFSQLCTPAPHSGAAPDEIAAEVSRLCVVGSFRRRRQEHSAPHVIPWTGGAEHDQEGNVRRLDRRREPEILLRLIHAAAQYGKRNNMRYYYALMAESLLRILARIGMRVVTIGAAHEHRGLRVPCLIDLDSLFLESPRTTNSAYDIFHRSTAYLRYSEWKESLEAPVSPAREAAIKSG